MRKSAPTKAIPLLTTGDALPTQRAIATYVVERQADYQFTVKGNRPRLESDIALLLETRGAADFRRGHAAGSWPH